MSFIGLFSELDSQPNLGIINYGVSMTTLEDVFLRLEAETEVDQAGEPVSETMIHFVKSRSAPCMCKNKMFFRFMPPDYSVFNREQAEDECDNASLDGIDQRLLTFSDSKSDVSGHALWRQQFSAVAWLHMLNMRRERKAFVYT